MDTSVIAKDKVDILKVSEIFDLLYELNIALTFENFCQTAT